MVLVVDDGELVEEVTVLIGMLETARSTYKVEQYTQ